MGGKSSGGKMGQGEIDQIAQTQAKYNRINQRTPFGTVDYSPSGDTAYVRLTPQEQRILSANQAGRLQAAQTAQGRFADLGTGRADVEQAHFQRALSLMNPEFDRRELAMQQRLANQGLPQTSGAYNREYGRFEQGVNQQLEQAALASVLAGGQEESRATQNILSLLGMGSPGSPQFVNPAPITIPVQQPQQGGASPLSGLLGLAGLGIGGVLGGPAGASLGLQAGTQTPALFGYGY